MISNNLSDIIELHDELLGELHRAVPYSQYNRPDSRESGSLITCTDPIAAKMTGHRRWASLDGLARPPTPRGTSVEPQVAGEVARVFGKIVKRHKNTLIFGIGLTHPDEQVLRV